VCHLSISYADLVGLARLIVDGFLCGGDEGLPRPRLRAHRAGVGGITGLEDISHAYQVLLVFLSAFMAEHLDFECSLLNARVCDSYYLLAPVTPGGHCPFSYSLDTRTIRDSTYTVYVPGAQPLGRGYGKQGTGLDEVVKALVVGTN